MAIETGFMDYLTVNLIQFLNSQKNYISFVFQIIESFFVYDAMIVGLVGAL